jgi:hypothetical protein
MDDRRERMLGLIVALLVAGAARADMVHVSDRNAERERIRPMCSRMERQDVDCPGPYDSLVAVDLDFRSVQFLPQAGAIEAGPTSQAPRAVELTGGPDSSGICMYALMSLGLCSAPHWVKKLHFGHVPEWYHDGGPCQIGHSHAATPESLCSLQVCLFAPPDYRAEDSLSQHDAGTIVSLWRESQFTLSVIASRGPPPS